MIINTSKQSPNHSDRGGAKIDMIVLHATAGSFASGITWLCNPASRVSSHYIIAKNGAIYQIVADSQAAWHAGRSGWRGYDSVQIQDHSIGVELANANDGIDPYPTAQFNSAVALCRFLIARYGIVLDMVVRHLDIAVPDGRKTDPAGFPWIHFKAALFPLLSYQLVGLPIYQRQMLTGPLAGYITTIDPVVIDETYANGAGHLLDGRGFVDINGLEAL